MILPEIGELNSEWKNSYNSNIKRIRKFYTTNAVLFSDDKIYIGDQMICSFYRNKITEFSTISNIYSSYRVNLKENSSMAYEMGCFITDKSDTYHYIIIWVKVNNNWHRELEAIAKEKKNNAEDVDIDTAREKWVKLANSHSAEILIKGTYSEKFVYYNKGTIYQGYNNLIEMYSYMNDPGFEINLKKDLVFEIGTWTTPGASGNYIIIWKRQQDGQWKILLDSNW